MTGRDVGRLVTDIPLPKPAYFDRFAHLLPDARFDQPRARIHFDARLLDVPLVNPDRAALRLASQACERQLEELGFARTLSQRVRRLCFGSQRHPTGIRGVDEVARTLGMSARTLKRRLAAEGDTYSGLVDAERQERALAMLRSPELTLEDIAHRLDYSSVPNFTRAFRRWTGKTPARYRRKPTSTGRDDAAG